jgi:hypothetical protein
MIAMNAEKWTVVSLQCFRDMPEGARHGGRKTKITTERFR